VENWLYAKVLTAIRGDGWRCEMMYDIVHKHKQSNLGILAAWGLYVVVILSVAGYHLLQIFW